MSTAAATMTVMAGAKFACIKIAGRANFSSSLDFKNLVSELIARGYSYFVLDLSDCLLMDSSFLGVMAGFGMSMNRKCSESVAIELLNPNAKVTNLLESLGVLHLFKMTQGTVEPPDDAQCVEHTPAQSCKADVTQACIEAHQALMAINPENVARFKDVVAFMAEDLKRLKQA